MDPALERRAVPLDDVLFQEVGEESVLLSLGRGRYFGLDPVGTRIWHLLPSCPNLASVHREVLEQYDVDPDRLRTDLLDLIHRLEGEGLVRVQ